jgi:hypothetical protein
MDKQIQQLTEVMQRKYAEMERQQKEDEQRYDRETFIAKQPAMIETQFYCPEHGDFSAIGVKVVFKDDKGQFCAYYQAKGGALFFTGRWGQACKAKRYITDKLLDPYYTTSEAIIKYQRQHADDFLQPNDPRFKLLYGDPFAERNKNGNEPDSAR